jgi:hypothetical protein
MKLIPVWNRPLLFTLAAMAALVPVSGLRAQEPADPLAQGFAHPPDSAKPRTWWHWTNGNVTKEGITKDLEWMKRVGIGGMQLSDVGSGGGQTVEKKILWGSPEWYDAVRHAAAEADRLGLEMSIFSSAGWSETGGPWIKPAQAMKKYVWSETTVDGPQHFAGKLASPPSNNGPFGNWIPGGGRGRTLPPDPTFYGDSAVVAFRTPADESSPAQGHPRATTNAGPIDAAALMDGDLNTSVSIAAPADGGPAWVQYEFAQPFAARAITIMAPGRGIPFGRIAVSADGVNFRPLVELPGPVMYRAATIRTYSFPETVARYFRLEMTRAAAQPGGVMSQDRTPPAAQYVLSEFVVHAGARVNHWQEKAGFNFLYDYESTRTPAVPSASTISSADLVDLTAKMAPDGTLDWTVPAGNWTILRLGYSLTGAKNRPAPPTGSGYEVDKFSAKDVEDYFHGYIDPIARQLGPLFGKSLRYVTMDSWEAENQNWTDEMLGEFRQRRGYDPLPYLPVLVGRVVENADVSDRFLWDFRRTIGDLLADSHYGTMARLLRERGIGLYAEASGVSMDIMEDTLLNKSKVEIPMGEFWVHALHPELEYYVDVRGAASASHAYGKTLVGTESFTGGGYEAPATLKQIGDYWFAQGVNRYMFHTSAEQPLDTKPGNTMVGTHLNRNITWAELAKPYMTYVARSSYLLQQGLFVADLAYLLPEGVPSSQPFWGAGLQPAPPDGYDYDCINTDVLLNRLTVATDGRLMLPDGMSYRVLVLPPIDRMTSAVLRKIRALVAGGATIVGPRAVQSPSLAGYPQADAEVQALAADVWGDLDGIMRNKRYYEKGRVYWGLPLADVLALVGVPRDFDYSRPLDSDVPWIHRRTDEADIYFLANHTDHPQHFDARFRVDGKEAEFWHPTSGAIEPASYVIEGGRTVVPVQLAERESVFVVFRHPAAAPARALPRMQTRVIATLGGPWDVHFPPHWGAPAAITLAQLTPWTASADAGVKYFSGTATYTKTVTVPEAWLRSGARVLLNLGVAKDVAEVAVNGQALGILWTPPYQVDVTGALKPGENQLEIKVTNEWTNRQIGDRLGPPEQRVLTSEPVRAFGRPAALAESGLLGPVTLSSSARE